MESDLYFVAQMGFVFLTGVFLVLLLWELKNGATRVSWHDDRKRKFIRRIALVLILWTVFVSVWSGTGIMADFHRFPINFLPVVAIPLITVVLFLRSENLRTVLKHIPIANIVRLQSFRFFVEVLLWMLFIANKVPEQMTFEGRNFDILAGISAPIVAWLAARQRISKTVLVVWNLLCLGLLINIVSIAILSTPSPWRIFMNEPANTIVTRFPVSWLPGLLVPLAYTLHLFSLRQLLQKERPYTEVP